MPRNVLPPVDERSVAQFPHRETCSRQAGVLLPSRILLRRSERRLPANPATAQHRVAVVKNRGLARRDSFLRFVQLHASTLAIERRQRSRWRGMAIANVDCDLDRYI